MEFLKGYIGLSSKYGIEAASGLYVDTLPDISSASIENIAREGEDVHARWEVIERRGLLKFRTLFVNEVNKVHKVSDLAVCECLIESNKEVLATALWYLLGSEVMTERASSQRINVTTINRDKPKELREYFDEQFRNELAVAVNSIDIHASKCLGGDCVEPSRPVSVFATPIL